MKSVECRIVSMTGRWRNRYQSCRYYWLVANVSVEVCAEAARQIGNGELGGNLLNFHLVSRIATKIFYNFVPVLPGEQWPSAMGFVDGEVGGLVLSLAVADIIYGRWDNRPPLLKNVSCLLRP